MKRWIACILCLVMAVTLLPMQAMAEEPEEDKFNYVSLGASTTSGFGLRGCVDEYFYTHVDEITDENTTGYMLAPRDSYPNLIYQVLLSRGYDAKLYQMAQCSMRVEELRFLLDETYPADEFTRWRFYNDSKDPATGWWAYRPGLLEELRAAYKENLTKADLITFDLSTNNFGVYLGRNLFSSRGGNDLTAVLGEEYASLYYGIREQGEAISRALLGDDYPQETMDMLHNFEDTLAYALLGYMVNFDATISKIREWNPDAQIIVMSAQNVIAGLNLSVDGIVIPLSDIFGAYVDLANAYMTTISPVAGEYVFADVSGNGRVATFLDDIVLYEGGDASQLPSDIRDCFDYYDNNFHVFGIVDYILRTNEVKSLFTNEEEWKAFYNVAYTPACYSAYDAFGRLMREGAKIDTIDVSSLTGDTGAVENELSKGVQNLLVNSITNSIMTTAGLEPEEFDVDAAIDAMLCDDVVRGVAAFAVRTSIGNSFFAHPNPYGCRQLASGALNAWDNEINAQKALAAAMAEAQADLVNNTLKYGTRFAVELMDAVGSAFGLGESVGSDLAAQLPVDAGSAALAELIMRELGIATVKDTEVLEKYIDEIAAACAQEPVHVHTGNYRKPVAATCTKEGSRGHYACACGKLFADGKCRTEISAASVVIKPLGHAMIHVPGVPATIFSTGCKEYYLCARCGEIFADAKGQHPTTLAELVLPRISLIRGIFGF